MCITSTRTLLGKTLETQTHADQDQELSFGKKQRCLKNVVFYGCLSLASLIVGASLSYPFYQSRRDDLGCDTLCYGAMTSTRSFLSLIGSTILGRISDSPRVGRMTCLYIGVVSSVVGFSVSIVDSNSIKGMWLSILPASLFQQNYSILKALFSDFHEDLLNFGGDDHSSSLAVTQSRANSAGKLGMSVGFAFMVGSFVGGTMLRSYEESIYYSIIFTALSGFFLWMMPSPHYMPQNIQTKGSTNSQKTSSNSMKQKILAQIDALPLSCLFILLLRVLMALAYNIFNTIWTVSLKRRFNFGPKQHGKFMAFVGFAYAIAQGYVAKQVIGEFHQKTQRKYLIMICCVVLGLGRWYVYHTTDVRCLYAVFTGIVTALGVMNIILTADTSAVVSSKESGYVFGLLEATQNGCGMVGPLLGGILTRYLSPVDAPHMAALWTVVGLYALAFMSVYVGYDRFVLSQPFNGMFTAPHIKNKTV